MKTIRITEENLSDRIVSLAPKINCTNLGELCKELLNGEPVFILRAQDENALDTIDTYLSFCPTEIEDRVKEAMTDIEEWQKQNKDKVKRPD